MATKAQHAPAYEHLPRFLRTLREEAGLTQRALGGRMGKPQSWVYNCEVANRRVDLAEFVAWADACGVEPQAAFAPPPACGPGAWRTAAPAPARRPAAPASPGGGRGATRGDRLWSRLPHPPSRPRQGL